MGDTVAAVLDRPAAPSEAPLTLLEPPPRALGLRDQLGLWSGLGVTLTLPAVAGYLYSPGTSLLAALAAIVVGSLLGSLLLGASAVVGASLGQPAMVVLRGLFGRRGSAVPTVLNVAQCLGWTYVEVSVIATAGHAVAPAVPTWAYALLGGTLATGMALRPLAAVRLLRRYAVVAVVLATGYLGARVLARPLPAFTAGGTDGFWPGLDLVLAIPVSWVPLVADYSRHARTPRSAFLGTAGGFAPACALYFGLGVLALAAFPGTAGRDGLSALVALPVAAVAVAVLVLDEVDEAFANLYSTAVSVQNVAPRLDRRVLAGVVGALGTGAAVALGSDYSSYETFLLLIGAVFLPLTAVLLVTFFVVDRDRWSAGVATRGRVLLGLPWLAGFVAYQLVTPTVLTGWDGWASWWSARASDLGLDGHPVWVSASVTSLVVAAALTLAIAPLTRTR